MPNDVESLSEKNQVISFVITESEHEYVKRIADDFGVSIATVGRGFWRLGKKKFALKDIDSLAKLFSEACLRPRRNGHNGHNGTANSKSPDSN